MFRIKELLKKYPQASIKTNGKLYTLLFSLKDFKNLRFPYIIENLEVHNDAVEVTLKLTPLCDFCKRLAFLGSGHMEVCRYHIAKLRGGLTFEV